ncbi:MAG TPA: hypothetical protein VIK91_26345 [Nannocystis sp.]
MSALRSPLGVLAGVAFSLSLAGCGGDGKSLADKLAEDPKQKMLEEAGYVKKEIKRPPTGLPPPTDEEFRAWDRKDPEGEKHLHKFDKANLKKMFGYWRELGCFREKMKEEGEKAKGAEPGSPTEEQWYQFKQVFIPMVNHWQQRLFANEPRILEKSKLIGHFLEAHELVMHGYPDAYNNNDDNAIAQADAHWVIVENKITKYLKNITDQPLPKWDLSDPKQKDEHDKFCLKALNPPKNTGKAKVKYIGGGGGKKRLNMADDD